jgi:hypothetical protein
MKHLILFFFLLVLLLIFASVFGRKQPERSQKTIENTHGKMRALSTDVERMISDI